MNRQPKIKEFVDTTDFPQTRVLQVNSCGSERVFRHEYTILRSKGRKDYHFLYLLNGWLDGEIGDTPFRLNAGQCVVFYPFVRQMYYFSYAGNPVSLFLHFTGPAAAEAMQFVPKLDNMVYTISERITFESLFKRLNQIHNLKTPLYIPEENSILLQLITILAKSAETKEPPTRDDVISAVAYLQEHMPEQIDLHAFADSIHLSYSRLVHLFSEKMGIPPQRYLQRLRLEKACILLRDTSMSISMVAENVGIDDQFYFSRVFRRQYNMSPRSYREECRKKEQSSSTNRK